MTNNLSQRHAALSLRGRSRVRDIIHIDEYTQAWKVACKFSDHHF